MKSKDRNPALIMLYMVAFMSKRRFFDSPNCGGLHLQGRQLLLGTMFA